MTMRRSLPVLLAVLLLASGAYGCGGECATDSDCKGERVCEEGACVDAPGGGGGGAASGDDSCRWANDGACDDPGACKAGTDRSDCAGGATPQDCRAVCREAGFAIGAADGQSCSCDEPMDADCALGAEAICFCNESVGDPCSSDLQLGLYVNCYSDQNGARPFVLCVGGYVDSNYQIDCDAAAACL